MQDHSMANFPIEYRDVPGFPGYREGKRHNVFVHRLVLMSFVGPCPHMMQCRHLDGNPLNNYVNNLAWGTHAENCQDTRKMDRYFTVLTDDQAVEIRARYAKGNVTQSELGKEFGVARTTINSLVNGYSWKHLARP